MAAPYRKSLYRRDIDGLRALAVTSVIINHFNDKLLPSGYLGVDIFFVISGFVITSSFVENDCDTFGDFLLRFYVRRIKRLIPALVLFVLATGVCICLFDQTPRNSLETGIASLFGLSNIYLLDLSTDYFARSTKLNVFTHTWSLGVEEQFYLIYPFIAWFSGFARATANGSRNLLWLTGGLAVISLLSFAVLYQTNQPAAYFLMPTRLWELAGGCLLFLGLRSPNSFVLRLGRVPPIAVTAGILMVMLAPLTLAIPATMAVVLLTVLLIGCLHSGTFAYDIFTRREVVFVGLISYSLYLWHWGVISLSLWTINIHWWSAPCQLALMFLLATLSYRLVETPLRRANWSASRFSSIGYGVSASATAAGLLFVLLQPWDGRLYLGRLLNIPTPPNLQRTWWADRRTGEYLEKCHVEGEFRSELVKQCLDVSAGQNGKIYLIGDSHARNYLPALREEFARHSVAYLTMGHGCAFLPKTMSDKRSNVRCPEYVEETTKYILQNTRPGDVVFVGQRLLNAEERQTSAYVDFIKWLAASLEENNVPVVVLDGVYPPELEPELCVDVPWRPFGLRDGCSVDIDIVAKAFARFDQLAVEASSQVTNLYYAPLRMGLCHDGVCGQTTARGLPIWHDRGHITADAAAQLAPLLHTQLTKQGFYQRFPAAAD